MTGMTTCPGSGHRTSPTGSSAFPEVRCPVCPYEAAPVARHGEHFVRSHRQIVASDDRSQRHPAEVTAARLLNHVERWPHLWDGEERDALALVRHVLHEIADGDRR